MKDQETPPGSVSQEGQGSLDVFITYARRPGDSEFVEYLEAELLRRGKGVWIDRSSIEPGSAWRDRILRGIRSCRAYVFVISAHSAVSSECRRELEEAEREHKKVIPVVLRDVPNDQLPEGLTRQNWVSFVNRDGWGQSLDVLIEALDTDIEWRDLHTRLLMRAEEWISSDKDRSFLLRGRDLQSGEDWYEGRGSHRETPTDDQVAFIVASRRGASRRLRVVTVAVGCGLVVSLLAAAIAIVQRQSAVRASQQSQSEQMAAEANNLLSTNLPLGMLLSIEAYERAPTAQAQDALTQSALLPLQGVSKDPARVMSVALSPKADELASGDWNGTVVLRNEHTGASRSWKAGSVVNTLAFSPDGSSLVTSGYDGVVSLWDVATGDREASWKTGGSVWSVAFSLDGRTVATGGDGGHLGLWDVTTGKRVVWNDPSVVVTVAFTPDGKYLITSDHAGLVAVWDPATRSRVASWSVGSSALTAVSPDGSTLAVGDADGQIVLIDRATGLKTILSDGSTVNQVAFSPDGRLLASGDTAGLVSVWDLATGTRTTLNDGAEVSSVAFSPDGRTLVTGDWDGDVIRWNGSTMRAAGSVLAMVSTPRNEVFATGDVRGHIAVWNASTGHQEQGWNEGSEITGLTVSPDGTVLAATDGYRQVTLLNRRTGSLTTWQSDAEQSAPAFGSDGRSLYTLSSDGTLLRWDLATGSSTSIARVGATTASANSVDGRLLAVIGADGRLSVWKVATGTRLASWPMSATAGVLAFGDNDRLLAVEPVRGQVSLWNFTDHTRVSDWSVGATVWNAAFTPNGKYLATVDENGKVGLWGIASGSHRSWSDGAALVGILVSPDGRTVVTGDTNGLVTAHPTVGWTGSFTTIRSLICARLGGFEMSPAQWQAYVPESSFAHICPAFDSPRPKSS
jgi:WD40 repeat protein